jgi:hypothetical protein
MQAAVSLLKVMRKVYEKEKGRQEAYIEWHNETYPALPISLPARSSASPSSGSF